MKLRVLSFYPMPFSSRTLGKRSMLPVCASALHYPPCKYGNSIDTTSHWSQSCNLSINISFPSVVGTSGNLSSLCIFWQCSWWNFRSGRLWLCEICAIHSELSLPTSFPSWLFIGVDIKSSPASLGTLLTAVVLGESGSVRLLRNLLISMDDWWWMRTCMILEVHG